MFTLQKPLVILGIVIGLSGCGIDFTNTKTSAGSEIGTFYATQVRVGQCIFARKEVATEALGGALAAQVIPKVIEAGVNRIGAVIAQAAASRTEVVTASTNLVTLKNKLPACIQVVRGEFHANYAQVPGFNSLSATSPPSEDKSWVKGTDFEGTLGALLKARLYLSRKPDFFFEGVLRQAGTNPTAWSLVPAYSVLNRPLFSRPLRSNSKRGVMLNFAFYIPGDDLPDLVETVDTTFGSSDIAGSITVNESKLKAAPKGTGTTINLAMMVTGKTLRFDPAVKQQQRSSAPGIPGSNALVPVALTTQSAANTGFASAGSAAGFVGGGPASPATPAQPSGTASGIAAPTVPANQRTNPYRAYPLEGRWFAMGFDDSSTGMLPIGMQVAVSETQGESAFLGFVSAVFQASQPGITTVLTNRFDPTSRRAKELADAKSANTLLTTFDNAVATAKTDLVSCAQNGTIDNAKKARNSMEAARIAALAAREKAPGFLSRSVALSTNKPKVEQSCKSILGNDLPPPSPPTDTEKAAFRKVMIIAFGALEACEKDPSPATVAAAIAAQSDANSKSGPAGERSRPFPVLVRFSTNAAQVKARCAAAKKSIGF